MKKLACCICILLAACDTVSPYGQPDDGSDAMTDATIEAAVDAGADATDSARDSRAGTTADAPRDTTARVCEPGRQEACACVGGAIGAQRCALDGMAWGECECPDAAADAVADSGADVVGDAVEDIAQDSGQDAPADTQTDTGTADSGVADAQDSGQITCGNGRFLVVEPGTAGCQINDGTGRVLDTKTGLTWMRKRYWVYYTPQNIDMLTQAQAAAYCSSAGMRLPTSTEVWEFRKTQLDTCAFPCGVASWTSFQCDIGKHKVASNDGDFCQKDEEKHSVQCVKP